MRSAAALALLFLGLLLPACGDEAPPAGPPDGSPGARSGGPLEELAARLADPADYVDAGWVDLVGEVGLLLWPAAAPESAASRRDHQNLALIAGDVSVQLFATGPGGRDTYAERDPTSLAIHDAFQGALAQGLDGYRAWVAGPGRALLQRRVEALTGR